jgi:hypothetical protein
LGGTAYSALHLEKCIYYYFVLLKRGCKDSTMFNNLPQYFIIGTDRFHDILAQAFTVAGEGEKKKQC